MRASLADLRMCPVDASGPLGGWEPWVRDAVLDAEAMHGLDWTPEGERGFSVGWREGNGRLHSIVSLLRPRDALATTMGAQVEQVIAHADLRADRYSEILAQIPQLVSGWTAIAGLHRDRTPATLALMGVAIRLAIAVEMRIKHALAVPRPVQYSPLVQPPIQTPSHSAFPSGHSTEAHCVARVLMAVSHHGPLSPVGDMLLRQAARIAINRTVAGVHFPMDSRAGQILGTGLAEYLVGRCVAGHAVQYRRFDAQDYLEENFVGPRLDRVDANTRGLTLGSTATPPASALLGWLWTRARAEWATGDETTECN